MKVGDLVRVLAEIPDVADPVGTVVSAVAGGVVVDIEGAGRWALCEQDVELLEISNGED